MVVLHLHAIAISVSVLRDPKQFLHHKFTSLVQDLKNIYCRRLLKSLQKAPRALTVL